MYDRDKMPHKRREVERSHREDMLLGGSGVLLLGNVSDQKLEQEKSNIQRYGGKDKKVKGGIGSGNQNTQGDASSVAVVQGLRKKRDVISYADKEGLERPRPEPWTG